MHARNCSKPMVRGLIVNCKRNPDPKFVDCSNFPNETNGILFLKIHI